MTTVTEDQVTLLRRVFDTYNARDVEALVELHHEDFELIPSPYYERPGTVFRGREGLRTCLEDVFTRFAKCEVSVDGFRELGDWVLLRMSAVDEDEPYPGAVGEVIWLYAIKDDLVIAAYGLLSGEDAPVNLMHKGFGSMLSGVSAGESTPPLYYCLAWVWAKAFGTSEAGLRSLSALIGTATIPLAYAIGRRAAGRLPGLIAAALCAFNPLLVWYSQEARSYALLVFLSGLTLLALLASLQQPTWRRLALWALAAIAALATHYFAGFLVGGEALWLLWRTEARARAWVTAAGVGGAAGALGEGAAAAVVLCAVGLVMVIATAWDERYQRDEWRDAAKAGGPLGQIRVFIIPPESGRVPLQLSLEGARPIPPQGVDVKEL